MAGRAPLYARTILDEFSPSPSRLGGESGKGRGSRGSRGNRERQCVKFVPMVAVSRNPELQFSPCSASSASSAFPPLVDPADEMRLLQHVLRDLLDRLRD